MIRARVLKRACRTFTSFLDTAAFRLDGDVRAFLRANRRFWQAQGSFDGSGGVVLAEGRLISTYKALTYPAAAAVVAAAYGGRVLYLFERAHQLRDPLVRLLPSYSACEVTDISSVVEPFREHVDAAVDDLYRPLRTPADILNLRYRDVPIGEQVYDEVLFVNQQASVWKVDENVRRAIRKAVETQEAVRRLMDRHDVRAGVFTHTTEAYHGVVTRTLLHRGRPVFSSFGGFGALKRYNRMLEPKRGRLKAPVHIPHDLFRDVRKRHRERILQHARAFLDQWNIEASASEADAPSGKTVFARREDFCREHGLDPETPCVFVMLHAFTDDPHVHEQMIFRDFYDWFMTTLEVIRDVQDVNWVFKEHPLIGLYPDDANRAGIIRALGCDHVVYLDEDAPFDSRSLPNVAHAIVTCAGTAALEYAAQGVPGVLAGRNHYAGYGVCEEPDSLEAYAATLRTILEIQRPDVQQQERALMLFYLIYGVVFPGLNKGLLPYRNRRQAEAECSSKELIRKATRRMRGAGSETLLQAAGQLIQFVRETESSTAYEELYISEKMLGAEISS